MAKKYKVGGNNLITMDSTLRQLKTVFEDKMLFLTQNSISSEIRERVMAINFTTLREIAKKLSIVNMCINCREQQITPFLKPAREKGQPGFLVYKKNALGNNTVNSNKGDKKAFQIMEMIQQTGVVYDSYREDDFIDFGKMLIREILTIDQIAIELQRNKKGEIAAFWLIDGATISRCFLEGYEGDQKIQFVQELDGEITALYTKEDIIFDYMFKRVEMKHRGFGYSLLEQSIDLITTLILGISYNRDLFTKDKIPKGFLAIQGEADRTTIESIERYWYAAMSGAGARFKIPILPSGKEGVGIDFKTLGQTNRDIEYHKLMLFFLSLFGGVFGIDLAELGIKTDNTQSLVSENLYNRQEFSKSRGLKDLLSFTGGVMNKIVSKIDKDYEFGFVGIEPEDEVKKYEMQSKAISSTRTINEMREADNLPPLEGDEYNMVLNPTLIQAKNMAMQQQQAEMMDGGMEGEEEGAEEENEEEDNWEIDEEDLVPEGNEREEDIEKSIQELDKHLEQLKKAGYEVEIEI